ncbi:hypothetical protein [Streptomyces roseoverticillatus]|uniref:Uncharacterized protein n=1 Tax=Streptomyces roseoverticillatus TaxID=66429 RepID=A0ABV3IZ51_9ACTN
MPSYDSSRERLRLADRHIAVFAHLLDGETPPEELFPSLDELQQIGLVGPEGELAPLMRDLLATLAEPLVIIQVEVTGQHGPVNHGILVGADSVFTHEGWPGEEESEYVPIEPATLVWALARMVNLRSREAEKPSVDRVETTMAALDAAFVALDESAGDEEKAVRLTRAALTRQSGLEGPELTEFGDLVLALNAHWRITVAWDGKHEGERAGMVRALAVWDGGPRGYWIREQPEEPIMPGQVGPDSALHLATTTSGEIWEKITELLPDKEDLFDEA